MKTVYDRLKPEIKEQLEDDFKNTPTIKEIVLSDLKSNTLSSKVTYGTFFELQLICKSLGWDKTQYTHFFQFLTD